MKHTLLKTEGGRTALLFLFLFAIAAAFALMPRLMAEASPVTGEGLFVRTTSHEEGLPNYDIRSDKSAHQKLAEMRSFVGREAADVADLRAGFVEGEAALRRSVPTLKVEYQPDLMVPELIAPDVKLGPAFLTEASTSPRHVILRNFLKQADGLIGVERADVDQLKVEADYENPEGGLAFVELSQELNGVPVFRGEVKAGFTADGKMIRVINNLAPGLDVSRVSTDFGDAAEAVRAAGRDIGRDVEGDVAAGFGKRSAENRAVFGEGDWATTAEKFYFPTEPGVAVPAWRVLIWNPVNAYYVVVSAKDGTRLWRKNITEDQTQHATYDVYVNGAAMINVADSPGPLTPGPVDPLLGTQGAILNRSAVTLVGNEGLYSFNNNGWINDGQNLTDGNNVESGLDLVSPDGIEPETIAVGNPNRVFSSEWNPPPGNPAPGEAPTTAAARRGAVIQQFYIMNRYHNELYRLGFTEAARNFQHNNFGRGGVSGDRISAQGQDYSGTNNANFSAPADGFRGRMQMYVWTGPDPDRDGTGDADIVIHEVTHGTSNRLHGNSTGLVNDMSRAMGEGWSDFYAHAMLSEPTDPLDGVYTLSGYSLLNAYGVVGTRNYYYGIRRFPKAIITSVGGPNNRPHNPTTFADIDQTKRDFSDGAFAPMSGPHVSLTADQVHAAGEIWSAALWEARAKLIARLGWENGNRRMLQYVTDGMKLSPLSPTFLNSRDAILAAANATGTAADVRDIWDGFAIRGMGASASIQNVGGTSIGGTGTTRVTEAFDLPNLQQQPAITIDDSTGNSNGAAEPGEPIRVTVPLTNLTGNDAINVTAQIVGGGSASYGNIAHNQTVSRAIDFTVPLSTPCGASVELTIAVNSSLGPVQFTQILILGTPQVTFEEDFDGVTAPAFPAGWIAEAISGGTNFVTTATNPHTPPNSAFALDPLTVGGGTDLTSPPIPVQTAAATMAFLNRYATELGWDGAVLEISIGEGAFQDILAAGGTFLQNGYNGTLGANGVNNPLAGRAAWTGDSGGYVATVVLLPASAQGQSIRLRWRFGADDNTAVTGWNVDTIRVAGTYACSYQPETRKVRADFDGDGRSDASVFRPSEGNWYTAYSSTAGLGALLWGFGTDVLVPGDYDNDGTTDHAIWRPSTGEWWIVNSSNWSLGTFVWGEAGDIPVAGDYDGDGAADAALYRPSNNTWYVRYSGGGFHSLHWGEPGDLTVSGDYDGDGKSDFAIWRPSTGEWWIAFSTGGIGRIVWGVNGDKPVQADYDGDGRDDVAVYRPSEGRWYIMRSSDAGIQTILWGVATDIPVPGDYDGDGKYDAAVYRDGTWYFNFSSGGLHAFNWGVAGDTPVPAAYLP